jgi:hypothetical protein
MDGLRSFPVERAHGLTPETFDKHFLSGVGKPVVVTDVVNLWPALSRWNFDLLKTRYGSDHVAPRIFSGSGDSQIGKIKLMSLGDYLDYLDAPEKPAPGLWVDAATLHPCKGPTDLQDRPLYLAWNVFTLHPELLNDITLSPSFVEDWLIYLPEALRAVLDGATKYFSAGILIGPRNAQIGLHFDFLGTHAYLAQILGTKRCTLFSPEDTPMLYEGRANPDSPEFEKFPLFRNATAYQCTLAPGELLFIPRGWWHHVVGLEKSITVNYNFFNRVNFSEYLTHILRDLPTILEGIEQAPDQRAALGITWKSKGFDLLDFGKS